MCSTDSHRLGLVRRRAVSVLPLPRAPPWNSTGETGRERREEEGEKREVREEIERGRRLAHTVGSCRENHCLLTAPYYSKCSRSKLLEALCRLISFAEAFTDPTMRKLQ